MNKLSETNNNLNTQQAYRMLLIAFGLNSQKIQREDFDQCLNLLIKKINEFNVGFSFDMQVLFANSLKNILDAEFTNLKKQVDFENAIERVISQACTQ